MCPADTAVGFTQTTYDTAHNQSRQARNIRHATRTPTRENPTPRTPWSITCSRPLGSRRSSASSFIGKVPFVLEAKLRSDGNYGVTVGDSAVAEKVLGNRATFCEYGAHANW